MIPVTSRANQNIALFGLGGSGLVTAQALMAGGARVTGWDDNPASVEKAREQGIAVADLRTLDFGELDLLVASPGVPLTHPKPHWCIELAQSTGVNIIGDIGLFSQERLHVGSRSRFIAITGTNGKSTTTALIAHALGHAGRKVQMGGNIGKAVLSLEPFDDDLFYVVECSSYQIDLAPDLNPTVGVLLNLAPDHLDRHGDMENYAAIKARLVSASAVAVIGQDDAYSIGIGRDLAGEGHRISPISCRTSVEGGVFVDGAQVISSLDGPAREVASLDGVQTLRGQHNAQNAAAAYAVCRHAGLSAEEIQAGFSSFPGLAHRMEIVGNLGKTMFVNDSKGTNADAAAMALSSFETIFWIVGGLAKEGGIEGLRPLFERVQRAFLIGEAAPEFAATLGGSVPFEIAGTMDVAVSRAAEAAAAFRKPAVVLLSPACASFDQFRNFEVRGDAFKAEVRRLEGFLPYGVDGQ